MNEDLTSNQYWGNPDTTKRWLDRIEKRKDTINDELNTEIISIPVFLFDVIRYDFKSFLEVGAGNGRLIGALSGYFSNCNSIDINEGLSKYVSKIYPKVKTFVGDVTKKLPFKDKSFDLVYTYQVLQHVDPKDIDNSLSELLRVCKKEVWLMEGYDDPKDYNNGHKRKGTDGGTWSWFFDRFVECYEVSTPHTDKMKSMGVRLYKIKKDANRSNFCSI